MGGIAGQKKSDKNQASEREEFDQWLCHVSDDGKWCVLRLKVA